VGSPEIQLNCLIRTSQHKQQMSHAWSVLAQAANLPYLSYRIAHLSSMLALRAG